MLRPQQRSDYPIQLPEHPECVVYFRRCFRLARDRHHYDSQDHVALRGYVAVCNTKQRVTELVILSIDISEGCQTVMAFYATSLQAVVGLHFKAPDVVYLARQWLDASSRFLPKRVSQCTDV